jgi:hypothetical protein
MNFEPKDYILFSVTVVGLIAVYFMLSGSVKQVDNKLADYGVQMSQYVDNMNSQTSKKINDVGSQMTKYQDDMSKRITVSDKICVSKNGVEYCLNANDLLRMNSMFPTESSYINVVNRRPLIGVGTRMLPGAVGGTPNAPQLLFNAFYYNPFGYNVPPPAKNAVRKWRMYAVYSDTLTGGDGPVLQLNIGGKDGDWNKIAEVVKFQFPITWGSVTDSRDAYSNVIDDPSFKMHSLLYSYIPDNATGTKLVSWNYVELQALDVYNN